MNRDEKKFLGTMLAIVLAPFVPVLVLGAEPQRKPTLTIACDASPQSMMLKAELTRPWDKPNPSLSLTKSQAADVAKRAKQFGEIQKRIRGHFEVRFVGAENLPLRLRLPAVRINRGAWESLDHRAFIFEGRPLTTIDWVRQRHCAICRDAPRQPGQTYWDFCLREGYSGAEEPETPAPWESGAVLGDYSSPKEDKDKCDCFPEFP